MREKGFTDTLKGHKRFKVIDVLDTSENDDDAYIQYKEYLSRNKDIQGIYVVAFGQLAVVKVLEELGLAGKVAVIVYDTTKKIFENIKKGSITYAIGQDPFRQSYDPVIHLYNYLVKGIIPETDKMWTRIELFNKERVKNFKG